MYSRFFSLFIIILASVSCHKNELSNDSSNEPVVACAITRTMNNHSNLLPIATFGKQTGHPFSIDNVRNKLSHLSPKNSINLDIDSITTTHLYIRFIPSSYDEMDSVQGIKDLNLYQYPLDCEITEGFVGIVNPFLINGFPQFWAVVPISFPLKTIKCPYVIESELWYPQERNNDTDAFLYSILCEYNEDPTSNSICSNNRSTHYPRGYIRYQDSVLGTVGVHGIDVEAYNFWHCYKDRTISDGFAYFEGHTFSSSFRFRVKFKLDDFCIKDGDNNSNIEYVTNSGTSSLDIIFSGSFAKYCAVFQAAQRYYYQYITIPRPPMNDSFWQSCLWIRVYPNTANNSIVGQHSIEHRFIWNDRPVIKIWGRNNLGDHSTDYLYGSTIHELAHAMHYSFDTGLFSSVERRVKESLANGVELYLSKQRYPSYESDNNVVYNVNRYTGVMRDLVDGEKSVSCNYYYDSDDGSLCSFPSPSTYYDYVSSAYTYPELIEAVRTCTTVSQWRNRIFNLYPDRLAFSVMRQPFDYWFFL